ncbi:hypothetical protein [Paraburkholderia sp. BCC1886]|uniref:hypothetical protein n=1 Tax=Paraburkholderia sp. BCC1886 TaxID=2562670 RepID=UPI0011828509|nr:hypothetical protein [Paraburkholderia sp. BCC1886]
MTPLVLDTRSLIREYAEYMPFFAFYEMGIKDVIRDAVLTRSFNSPYTTNSFHGHRTARGFVAKVLDDFEFALDHYSELGETAPHSPLLALECAAENLAVIRFVAAEIELAADTLLHQHLATRLFEIAQDGSRPSLQPRWIADDLLVFVRTLRGKEY